MAITALNPVTPIGSVTFTYDLKQVEDGLPLSVLDEFAAYSGVTKKELLEVVIPLRTLKHRKQKHEPLNLDESDRLARVGRMFELAARVYGNAEDARDWLTTPKHRFGERTPLAMLRTSTGELLVQEFLIQIDEGYFA
jgi:putative toxin-antitoxin system antitoxin component (TIGR02293 family)